MLLNVGQEIMFQHQGDFRQLQGVNALALEEAIDRGAFQVDFPRKLRYTHPALVEDGFDLVSDM